MPVFVTSVVSFAFEVLGFARGIAVSRVLGTRTTQTVVVALAVMAVARAIPLGVVQFHVQALAGLVALLPLAAAMARQRSTSRPIPHQTSPAPVRTTSRHSQSA